jgi:hypothetical protein
MSNAAAAVTRALLGGLLLTAQWPVDSQTLSTSDSASVSPSALPDPARAAWITGHFTGSAVLQDSQDTSKDGGVVQSHFYHWVLGPIEMSDPRLSGLVAVTYNQDTHRVPDGDVSSFTVFSGTYRITNEEGSWEGTNLGLSRGPGSVDTVTDTGLLVGSGAYEGLTAYLVFDFTKSPVTAIGAIFPGQMPQVATFD